MSTRFERSAGSLVRLGEVEVVERRGLRSKTYQKPDGGFHTIQCIAPFHRLSDPLDPRSGYLDLEVASQDRAADMVIDAGPYSVTAQKGAVSFTYTSAKGWSLSWALVEPAAQGPVRLAWDAEAETLNWTNRNFDILLVFRPYGIGIERRVGDKMPHKLVWSIVPPVNHDGNLEWEGRAQDSHDRPRRAELLTSVTGVSPLTMTEELTGRVSVIVDPATRQREWRAEAVYPLVIR